MMMTMFAHGISIYFLLSVEPINSIMFISSSQSVTALCFLIVETFATLYILSEMNLLSKFKSPSILLYEP
jgi:hypothetical protein